MVTLIGILESIAIAKAFGKLPNQASLDITRFD